MPKYQLYTVAELPSFDALRGYVGRSEVVCISGLAGGMFSYDETDTSSSDDDDEMIVGNDGRRWAKVSIPGLFTQSGSGAVGRTFTSKAGDIVSVADFGTVGVSEAADNALYELAETAVSSSGCIINPRGSLVNFESVSVPNGVMVIDMAGGTVISSSVAVGKSAQAGGLHLLVRDVRNNTGTRMHIEPNGYIAGTASKLDWMFDPYEDVGGTAYRLFNVFLKNYDAADASTKAGSNGVAFVGAKMVGDHFGVAPAIHLGFQDDGASSAVPLKLLYFDTSDSAWREIKGAWRTGLSVTTGDYYLANNKLYLAASTGTTGATKPSHTTGDESDGTVTWTFVRDYAAASGSFRGVVLVGDRDDMPKFGLTDIRMQFAKAVAFWNGICAKFLNNAGALAWKIGIRSLSDDLYIENEAGTVGLRFGTNYLQKIGMANVLSVKTVSSVGTGVIDVSGAELVILNFTGTVTGFTGTARQLVCIRCSQAITFTNSASFLTSTGADKSATANYFNQWVADGGGTSWIEAGKL